MEFYANICSTRRAGQIKRAKWKSTKEILKKKEKTKRNGENNKRRIVISLEVAAQTQWLQKIYAHLGWLAKRAELKTKRVNTMDDATAAVASGIECCKT